MAGLTMSLGSGVCARPAAERTDDGTPHHRLARFAAVGGAATALQLGLFALMQVLVPVFWANVIAWSASTVVANQVNRSLTFGVHGTDGARKDFWVSAGFSVFSLVASVVALAEVSDDQPVLSIVVLVAVNAVVGLVRFFGLRHWFDLRTS